MKIATRSIALLLIISTLGACMFHGGEQQHLSTPTLGQELTDLKTAFDSGALTDQEYQAAREKIINSCARVQPSNKC